MSDCNYPHRITIALTHEAVEQFKKEMNVRHMMGDLSLTAMSDLILLHMLVDLENPKRDTFPLYLDSPRKYRRTIVPCKKCHEHPCTCKRDGKDPHFTV